MIFWTLSSASELPRKAKGPGLCGCHSFWLAGPSMRFWQSEIIELGRSELAELCQTRRRARRRCVFLSPTVTLVSLLQSISFVRDWFSMQAEEPAMLNPSILELIPYQLFVCNAWILFLSRHLFCSCKSLIPSLPLCFGTQSRSHDTRRFAPEHLSSPDHRKALLFLSILSITPWGSF